MEPITKVNKCKWIKYFNTGMHTTTMALFVENELKMHINKLKRKEKNLPIAKTINHENVY